MKVLECESKLYLRSIQESDTDNVLRWRNSQEVKQYFIYQANISKEEHLNWLEKKVKTGKVIQFIIVEKDTDFPIGSVYLQDVDRANNKAEYGIFIGEKVKNRGYGTLVTRCVLKYAFEELNLHRVYLRVYEDNERAITCYEKAGFIREAMLRDDVYVNKQYRNIVLMGIINPVANS